MGLFKSTAERRIERDMRLKAGLRSIERSIRQQDQFTKDFVSHAQHARRIGETGQYNLIRSSLKNTATIKKMLERQLLSMRNAMLIQQQAAASSEFAQSMALMANEIGRSFGATDLTKTQAAWEKAVNQASSMEERMGLFLEAMESSAESAGSGLSLSETGVSDAEFDRMIDTDMLAQERGDLASLDKLASDLERELTPARQ